MDNKSNLYKVESRKPRKEFTGIFRIFEPYKNLLITLFSIMFVTGSGFGIYYLINNGVKYYQIIGLSKRFADKTEALRYVSEVDNYEIIENIRTSEYRISLPSSHPAYSVLNNQSAFEVPTLLSLLEKNGFKTYSSGFTNFDTVIDDSTYAGELAQGALIVENVKPVYVGAKLFGYETLEKAIKSLVNETENYEYNGATANLATTINSWLTVNTNYSIVNEARIKLNEYVSPSGINTGIGKYENTYYRTIADAFTIDNDDLITDAINFEIKHSTKPTEANWINTSNDNTTLGKYSDYEIKRDAWIAVSTEPIGPLNASYNTKNDLTTAFNNALALFRCQSNVVDGTTLTNYQNIITEIENTNLSTTQLESLKITSVNCNGVTNGTAPTVTNFTQPITNLVNALDVADAFSDGTVDELDYRRSTQYQTDLKNYQDTAIVYRGSAALNDQSNWSVFRDNAQFRSYVENDVVKHFWNDPNNQTLSNLFIFEDSTKDYYDQRVALTSREMLENGLEIAGSDIRNLSVYNTKGATIDYMPSFSGSSTPLVANATWDQVFNYYAPIINEIGRLSVPIDWNITSSGNYPQALITRSGTTDDINNGVATWTKVIDFDKNNIYGVVNINGDGKNYIYNSSENFIAAFKRGLGSTKIIENITTTQKWKLKIDSSNTCLVSDLDTLIQHWQDVVDRDISISC